MDEGKLWSLIRNVLSQGGAIQLARASMSGYEEYSARLDAAASDRVADFAKLSDARIAELELECSQWREELRIYRETENARIAELEQSVTVRDAEIARLETDLEVARIGARRYETARRMDPRMWADACKLHLFTSKPFDEIIDQLRPFMFPQDAARAGNGGEG